MKTIATSLPHCLQVLSRLATKCNYLFCCDYNAYTYAPVTFLFYEALAWVRSMWEVEKRQQGKPWIYMYIIFVFFTTVTGITCSPPRPT